jgi:uncharacterized protein
MVSLLDVNVLIALAWPNHVHHEAAVKWFKSTQRAGWATSPSTQSGFVRVSSNPKIVPLARPVPEALSLLRRLTALEGHHFWVDDIQICRSPLVHEERLASHRQISDAHLLGLALRHKGRLATFDRGLRHLVPSPDADRALVILAH